MAFLFKFLSEVRIWNRISPTSPRAQHSYVKNPWLTLVIIIPESCAWNWQEQIQDSWLREGI